MMNPFLRVLNQTVSWEAKSGVDQYGAPMFAAPVTVACRWRHGPHRVQTATGVTVVAADVLWCSAEVVAKAEDRFTLPDGRVTLCREIQRAPGPRGELYITRITCY